MSDLTAITRKEKIISGEDLKPITREEMFLQKYRGSGGGGGSSVQSDLAQNDPTASDYVKNRTHYVIPGTETRTNTLTWDGDTTGKTIVNANTDTVRYFVKMSDSVCTAQDLIGGTLIVTSEERERTLQITEEMVHSYPDENVLMIEYTFGNSSNWAHLVIAVEDTALADAVITKGTYFVNGKFEYTSSFTAVTDCFVLKTPETVKPLDGKFLPKGLGYIIKEGEQTKTNTLIFDGNIEGKEVIEGAVKVSDAVANANDLIGASMVIFTNGEEITGDGLLAENIMDMSSQGMPAIVIQGIVGGDVLPLVFIFTSDYSADGLTATKGTYFTYSGENEYTKSLTCLTDCFVSGEPTEVQKIDNRLLDVEWLPTKTVKEIPIWNNFSINLRGQQDGIAEAGIPNSDEHYFELVTGKTYKVIWNGTTYDNLTALEIESFVAIGNLAALGFAGGGEYPFVIASTPNGLAIADVTTSENVTVTVSVAEVENTPNKLPEEYLPETLLSTIASLEARIAELEGASATE